MTTANNPAGSVSLDMTNPDEVKKALRGIFGEEVSSLMRENLKAALAEMGLDKIDRSHLQALESLTPATGGAQKKWTVADAIDRHGWDSPQVRAHRWELMRNFFRFTLCGTPLNQADSLGAEAEPTLIRTLSTTDAEGGYLIPPGFLPEVTRDMEKLSSLFAYVRKVPVAQNTGSIPKVGTNATVYWGSENTDISQGDPAFTESTWSVNRMNSLLKLSREIVADSNPEIVALCIDLFQRSMVEERDKVIATGNNSGRPWGLYSATGITNVSITSLTYANLVNLKHSVDMRYQMSPGCRWTMNQNVFAGVEKVLDNDGRPIFNPGIGSTGPTILGKPFSIENSFPNSYLGFGDLNYYLWFDRGQKGVERTTEGDAFLKHQVWIKFFERVDGRPVLPPTSPMARTRVITGVSDLT